MKLDAHRIKEFSYMGALLSFILLVILAFFAYSKMLAWKEKQDVDVMGAVVENAFDYNDKFTAADGLFIAAALTEYDNNPEIIEDARYGELIIKQWGWGNTETIGIDKKMLSYHWCSDEELGLAPGAANS